MSKKCGTFSVNLKRIRLESGLTQGQLADMVGMVNSNISHFEGGRAANQPALIKLADALNVSVDELIRDTEQGGNS